MTQPTPRLYVAGIDTDVLSLKDAQKKLAELGDEVQIIKVTPVLNIIMFMSNKPIASFEGLAWVKDAS